MAYLLEEDSVDRFLLEDGSGDILLELGVNVAGDEDFWVMPTTIPISNDFTVTKF